MKTTGVSGIPKFGLLFFWDTLSISLGLARSMQSDLKSCQYRDRIVVSYFDYGVVALGIVCVDIFCQHHLWQLITSTLGHTLLWWRWPPSWFWLSHRKSLCIATCWTGKMRSRVSDLNLNVRGRVLGCSTAPWVAALGAVLGLSLVSTLMPAISI